MSKVMVLTSSLHVAEYFRTRFECSDVEEFWVAALNSQFEVICARMLFRGTADSCLVHPRDVFRFGLLYNAVNILIAHNHPSGVTLPSQADIKITKKLRQAGRLLQIPLIDHVIVGKNSHFSFADTRWDITLLQQPFRDA